MDSLGQEFGQSTVRTAHLRSARSESWAGKLEGWLHRAATVRAAQGWGWDHAGRSSARLAPGLRRLRQQSTGTAPWASLQICERPRWSRLQYFGHLTLEKTVMVGNTEGKRRSRQQRMRWSDSISDSTDVNLSKLQEIAEDRGAWCVVVHGGLKELNTT